MKFMGSFAEMFLLYVSVKNQISVNISLLNVFKYFGGIFACI